MAGLGQARQGMAVKVRGARYGQAWFGGLGEVWFGEVWLGGLGLVRLG
jgi:hypothetical protein